MMRISFLAMICVLGASICAQAGGGGGEVPEIGPNSLASALTVVIGGLLLLTSRKRKQD